VALPGYPPADHLLGDLGMVAEVTTETTGRVRIRATPQVAAADGGVRAGVLSTPVDIAGGAIAARALRPDWMATADLALELVGPLSGPWVETRGSLLRRGRTTLVVEALVVGVDENGNDIVVGGRVSDPVAWASMTFAVRGLNLPVLEALPVLVLDGPAGCPYTGAPLPPQLLRCGPERGRRAAGRGCGRRGARPGCLQPVPTDGPEPWSSCTTLGPGTGSPPGQCDRGAGRPPRGRVPMSASGPKEPGEVDPRRHVSDYFRLERWELPGGDVGDRPTSVAGRAPVDPHQRGPGGGLRTGGLLTNLDSLGGFTSGLSVLPQWIVTTSLMATVSELAHIGPLRMRADVLRRGRNPVVTSLGVVDEGARDRHVAPATMSCAVLDPGAMVLAFERPFHQAKSEASAYPVPPDEFFCIEPGEGPVTRLRLEDRLRNPWGILHGGAVAMPADEAACRAAVADGPATVCRYGIAASDVVLHYLRPVRVGRGAVRRPRDDGRADHGTGGDPRRGIRRPGGDGGLGHRARRLTANTGSRAAAGWRRSRWAHAVPAPHRLLSGNGSPEQIGSRHVE
jgi:acyl-coenzyme A thioesterase PaaI-like protein